MLEIKTQEYVIPLRRVHASYSSSPQVVGMEETCAHVEAYLSGPVLVRYPRDCHQSRNEEIKKQRLNAHRSGTGEFANAYIEGEKVGIGGLMIEAITFCYITPEDQKRIVEQFESKGSLSTV